MLLKAALLVAAGACDPELPECRLASTDAADVVLVASSAASEIDDLHDGSTVELIAAPQGGFILLVGARVRTSADCQLQARAALRDPATQRVIGLEERPLLLERHSDGWAVPQQGLSAMPNLAVCPNATLMAIAGHEFPLEVRLSTMDSVTLAMLTANVTPTCTNDACEQECSGGSPLD